MSYYNWRGFCLCGTEDLPPDAAAADAPFAPLVILVRRDPLTARGLYAIERPEELLEQPGPASLQPCTAAAPELPEAAAALVRAHGATVLNTAFRNAFSVLEAQLRREKTRPAGDARRPRRCRRHRPDGAEAARQRAFGDRRL